jgi:hypothetical protein
VRRGRECFGTEADDGEECGMGSPVGRSAMGFVGAAFSEDMFAECGW